MYADTSTIFALYILEEKSQIADHIIRDAGTVYISALTDVEFYSALRKRGRMGEISGSDIRKTYSLYKTHRKKNLYHFLNIHDADFKSAELLLNKTTRPLRTLDALHLGIADNYRLPLFTFDDVLQNAAGDLGIQIISYSG